MKKIISAFALGTFLLATASIQAGEFATVKKKIADARDSAVVMLKNKDQRGSKEQEKVKETAEAVSEALHKLKAPQGKESEFQELHHIWMSFKKTREEEVIPQLLEGKEDSALKTANGIQKRRLDRMNELCDQLEK